MSCRVLDSVRTFAPGWGLVLGSGLGGLMEAFESVEEYSMSEIESLPTPRVPGHVGRLILAKAGAARVAILRGRVHLYEGYDAREVTAGVRFLADCGVGNVVFTNAAGGVNRDLVPGQWMLIRDHLNLTGASPLHGSARFLDLSAAYSPELREALLEAAGAEKLVLPDGVYAGLRGPQYETPAEVAMLRTLGADAVGMSTVLEVIEARAHGLAVAGCSLITNHGAGVGGPPLSHGEVMEMGAVAGASMGRLLARMMAGRPGQS